MTRSAHVRAHNLQFTVGVTSSLAVVGCVDTLQIAAVSNGRLSPEEKGATQLIGEKVKFVVRRQRTSASASASRVGDVRRYSADGNAAGEETSRRRYVAAFEHLATICAISARPRGLRAWAPDYGRCFTRWWRSRHSAMPASRPC